MARTFKYTHKFALINRSVTHSFVHDCMCVFVFFPQVSHRFYSTNGRFFWTSVHAHEYTHIVNLFLSSLIQFCFVSFHSVHTHTRHNTHTCSCPSLNTIVSIASAFYRGLTITLLPSLTRAQMELKNEMKITTRINDDTRKLQVKTGVCSTLLLLLCVCVLFVCASFVVCFRSSISNNTHIHTHTTQHTTQTDDLLLYLMQTRKLRDTRKEIASLIVTMDDLYPRMFVHTRTNTQTHVFSHIHAYTFTHIAKQII